MGELTGAEQMAAGALGLDPEDHRSLGFLARVQMDLGKTGAALKTLRTLQALAPDDADVLSGLGTLLRSEGLIAESIEALRSAQSVRPDNGQILVSLGASYHARRPLRNGRDLRAAGAEASERFANWAGLVGRRARGAA